MSNDSSFGNVGQFSFDLDSQKGVTQLLMSVRASELRTEQKNELRDLVFQYVNGGKDQSVRISVEQKLNKYGIAPVAIAGSEVKESRPMKRPVIGAYRPAPVFSALSSIKSSNVKEALPTQVIPPRPVTAPEPIIVPPPVIREPIPEPVVIPEPEPVKAEPVAESPLANVPDVEAGLRRIREIKSIVNEKIGNPVNLVDINNDVGREYMSAVLDAMKKLNTGSSAVSAMKRLEAAYELVEKTIAEHEEAENQPQPQPQTDIPKMPEMVVPPTVIREPVREPVAAPEPEPAFIPEPVEIYEPQREPEVVMPVPEPEPAFIPEPIVIPEPEPEPEPVESIPQAPEVIETPIPIPRPVIPILQAEEAALKNQRVDETRKVSDNSAPTEWVSETSKEIESTVRAASLAETKTKLRTPDELPLASAIETSSVDGDPLYTKEVDEGLQQLLLEWPIFKKSGLFGTGAKGVEHPLFKKISTIQIPLLLAGRFDGATQEIKQSITDYMNGWRYEQGIIYKQGENFEHYLRRVIRHIIDLQRKKRPLS